MLFMWARLALVCCSNVGVVSGGVQFERRSSRWWCAVNVGKGGWCAVCLGALFETDREFGHARSDKA